MKLISWRTRVSIPVPSECESDALPLELVPRDGYVNFNYICFFLLKPSSGAKKF